MSYPKDIFSRMFGGVSKSDKGLLYPKLEEEEDVNLQDVDDALQTNIFNIMLSRRSQRKFENKEVEDSKVEMILAAADTAPTAGG
ncbi:MAG: nitroreductase family protein, partial [Nitrososphaeraceae archaeon]